MNAHGYSKDSRLSIPVAAEEITAAKRKKISGQARPRMDANIKPEYTRRAKTKPPTSCGFAQMKVPSLCGAIESGDQLWQRGSAGSYSGQVPEFIQFPPQGFGTRFQPLVEKLWRK